MPPRWLDPNDMGTKGAWLACLGCRGNVIIISCWINLTINSTLNMTDSIRWKIQLDILVCLLQVDQDICKKIRKYFWKIPPTWWLSATVEILAVETIKGDFYLLKDLAMCSAQNIIFMSFIPHKCLYRLEHVIGRQPFVIYLWLSWSLLH